MTITVRPGHNEDVPFSQLPQRVETVHSRAEQPGTEPWSAEAGGRPAKVLAIGRPLFHVSAPTERPAVGDWPGQVLEPRLS